MKFSHAALASVIEMFLKEKVEARHILWSIEADPTEIKLLISMDPSVPGGWAISATGQPLGQSDRHTAWLQSGDTGSSSKAIFNVMMGLPPEEGMGDDWPGDASDFGRCHRLLERFPEWRPRMPEVAEAFPGWKPLVDSWDRLTALYAEESPSGVCDRLYALLHELYPMCMRAAGWRETGPGSWERDRQ